MVDSETLVGMSASDLADYLWSRLREEVLDPPLDERGGPEPPPRFVLAAVQSAGNPEFKGRVIEALRRVLQRASMEWIDREPAQILADAANDSLLAGIGFMVAELPAPQLRQKLLLAANALIGDFGHTEGPTLGQAQLLRALAHVQRRGELASFWRELWSRVPWSYRALVFYGWARADAGGALLKIGELVRSEPEVHLPSAVWALLEPGGPSIFALGCGAAEGGKQVYDAVREALQRAGADANLLRDFDLCRPATDSPASMPVLRGIRRHSDYAGPQSTSWCPPAVRSAA